MSYMGSVVIDGQERELDVAVTNWPEMTDEDRRKRWRFEAACAAMQSLIRNFGLMSEATFTAADCVSYADQLLTELDRDSPSTEEFR